MRLFSGLNCVTPLRSLVSRGAIGVLAVTSGCGSKSENTGTTQSLTDGGADASVDAGEEPMPEEAGVSSATSGTTASSSAATTRETTEASRARDTDASTRPDTGVTSEPPNDTSDGSVSTSDSNSSSSSEGHSSEPPLPASCGNGELEGTEMCCRESDINTALQARFAAAELLLNGDLGCAPAQASQADNISYEMCTSSCGTDVGCAVSASNVELTYDAANQRFTGIADVVIEGAVSLSIPALNQTVNCDSAHVLFEEVAFTGELVTETSPAQATVDVRNIQSELGIPVVTGCAQANVLSAAFLLMEGPIETAVAEAVEQALEGTVAQPVQCPY